MNIRKYLHLSYDFTNIKGVSCFGLYAKIMHDVFGFKHLGGFEDADLNIKTPSTQEAAAAFAIQLKDIDNGVSKFTEIQSPEDYCLVIMYANRKGMDLYHCGMWYNNKIIHAKGHGKRGKVWYEEPSKFKEYNMRFFRYVD